MAVSVFMPEVDPKADFAKSLAEARKQAGGAGDAGGSRQLALVTPGRLVLLINAPPIQAVSAEMVQSVRAIVPQGEPQVIAAVGFTDVVKQGVIQQGGGINLGRLNELIPFTGYLIGMATVGHNVGAFEGHPSALAAGCAGADLLVVDEAMAAVLQPDWVAVAARAMRSPQILRFRRDGGVEVVDPASARWSSAKKARRWWPF